MRRSNKRGAQKAYASPVKKIYSYYKPHRVRKLAEEEVDLSVIGLLMLRLTLTWLSLTRFWKLFVDCATNASTLFLASVPFFYWRSKQSWWSVKMCPITGLAVNQLVHFKGTWARILLLLGCPFSGRPSYKFGFRSSVQKNGLPGEGRHEGLVPRNDVLTNGFIGFSLARTLARILFVPRLPPRNPEGVANLEKAICVVRSDSIIGVTL